ncbi:MAG: hypothetical protein NT014_07855 [Candidatus Omnitrophica bacterium]|nr:hypothetical protein [Candidatus Omnitrophota bacterium]
MAKVKELFHKIGNLHNKISVGAGLTKVELEQKFKNSPIPKEVEKAMERLSDLENIAIEASKDLRALKDVIYNIIDPDTGKVQE